jgi:hypothetical protein
MQQLRLRRRLQEGQQLVANRSKTLQRQDEVDLARHLARLNVRAETWHGYTLNPARSTVVPLPVSSSLIEEPGKECRKLGTSTDEC